MKNLLPFIVVFMSACALASCSSGSLPPIETALQDSHAFEQRNLTDTGLATFAASYNVPKWPPATWTENDLTLAALYFRSDVKIARSQWQEVQASTVTAGQSPNPVVTVAPSRDTSTNPFTNLLALGFNWTIETNGKKQLRVEQAQAAAEAAGLQYESAVWNVRRDVASAFYAMQSAHETAAAYRALAGQQKDLLDAFASQQTQGQTGTANARLLNITYHQTLLSAQQADKAEVDARNLLAAAVDVSSATLASIRFSPLVGAKKLRVTPATHERAVRENAEIKAALATYKAAHKALELEVAKQVPDIDLGPGYEWNSQQGGKYTLGLSFTLPIMNNNEGAIGEAKAKTETAAHSFNQTQDRILSAMDQAQQSYKAAYSAFSQAQNISAAETQRMEDASTGLTNPALARLPLRSLAVEKSSLQISLIDARAQLLQAAIAVQDAYRVSELAANFDPVHPGAQ